MLSPVRPPLNNPSATRPGQLTLANVINDGNDSSGLLHLPGATWVGPAVTNLWATLLGARRNTTETYTRDSTDVPMIAGVSDKVVCPGSVVDEGWSAAALVSGFAGATAYTASVIVQVPNGATMDYFVDAFTAADAYVESYILAFVGTGAKQALSITFTTGATVAKLRSVVRTRVSAQAVTIYVASGNSGQQCETGSVANPYTASTRAAGSIVMPWDRGLFTETQGWFALRWVSGYAGASIPFVARQFSWGNAADNMIRLSQSGTAYNLFNDATGGAAAQQPGQNYTPVAGTAATVFGMWTASDLGVSADGAALTMAGSRSEIPVITATTFNIGGDAITAGRQLIGNVLWAACGPMRPTNANVAAINAIGNTKPTIRRLDQVARGAHAMAVFDGRGGTFQRRIAS